MDNLIDKNQKDSDNNLLDFNERMRRKNVGHNGDSPQQKQPKFEDFEKLLENFKKLEEENCDLKTELKTSQHKERDLELKITVIEKELDEFKRINTIQENCIENSESEILRLNECLRVTELMLQETVEVSEEIISDLKSKLKIASDAMPKSATNIELSTVEVKVQAFKRQKSKPSFYLELNRNDFNDKNKRKLKVLKHQMSDDLRHSVIQIMRQLSENVDSLDQLSNLLTEKLNKTFGKFWFCVIGENIIENLELNATNKSYLKCELGENRHIIVFKYCNEIWPTPSGENSQENSSDLDDEQLIRIVRKSHNIEAQVEKFIVNIALESLNRTSDDYHSLSSLIRDAICNKYNSQWFISVGQTQHYCTSWALSRSRKFMLFEIGHIKFTIGEVAGWLW